MLLRLGEITIKGPRTRERFERILVRNIEDALSSSGVFYSLRRERGRIFVYADDEEKASAVLRRVFGIKSLSIAVEITFKDLEELIRRAEEYFAAKVKGKSFAVRARRTGRHDFKSPDIERQLGSVLLKYASRVDLEKPEITAYVEVREDRAYFYTNVVKAYGGLPIGSEGKAIALVSGGFDSPVAAWYMLRRGVEVHYLLCNLGGPVQEIATLHVMKVIADRWSYGYRPKLYVVDFAEIVREIRRKCDVSLLNVILKRFMYRAAEAIAAKEGADAIVTGESVGQASSQTLRNLRVSTQAVKLQVLRPLIGFDKDDIVALAREIGTYDASARVKEYCGAFSEHPKTRTTLEEVEAEEAKLDPELLDRALSTVKTYDLRSVTIEENLEGLEIDNVPEGSTVIDLRGWRRSAGKAPWKIVYMELDQLLEKVNELDPSSTYVLVCEEGALSLEAAYILRKMGFKAYSLRGGVRRLRKLL